MRQELKFVCDPSARARLLAELQLLPFALRTHHARRTVQSLYFDTWDREALYDNLAGVAERRKLRLRWYGEATRGVHGQLELKRRSGTMGDKLVLPLPAPVDVEGARATSLVDTLRQQCTLPWGERLHRHEPVMWTRYVRDYLVGPAGEVRVTLDSELCAFEQRLDPILQCRRAVLAHPALIVEIKAAAQHTAALQRLVQTLPLVRSKCSKFAWACAPDEAPIVSRGLL